LKLAWFVLPHCFNFMVCLFVQEYRLVVELKYWYSAQLNVESFVSLNFNWGWVELENFS